MPPGVPHRFVNESDKPMTIAYFYPLVDAPRYPVGGKESQAWKCRHLCVFFTASVLVSSNITIAAKKCEKGKVFMLRLEL
mgnify:CR=1 FL=1